MKPKKLSYYKKSERKKLRDEIGKLHFDYLVRKRGNRCEISKRPPNGLGRFHILSVGAHPKLEFVDENVLLVNWLPYHYWWHHDIEKARKFVEPVVIKLRGVDYRERLLAIEKIQSKHSIFYLRTLKMWFEKEANNVKGIS